MKILQDVRSIVAHENAQQVKESSPGLILNKANEISKINLDRASDDLSTGCTQCMFERSDSFDCAGC